MKLEAMDVSRTSSVVSLDAALAPGFRLPADLRAGQRRSHLDTASALIGLALTGALACLLFLLNPFFNPGPVFYRQMRMGQGGRRFMMWKFRTMTHGDNASPRAAGAPVEADRITRLGAILRRTRLDEVPNFINVWNGDMALVGPRPDIWEHSLVYSGSVRHYAQRFRVKPGITGLAQVRSGYADTTRAVERKARLDLFYVERASVALDTYIVFRTVWVMLTGFGAK